MNLSDWFRDQLETSGEGFVWSLQQVPGQRLYLQPPLALGEWSAVRHGFHLVHYEQTIALPSMRQWLGGSFPAIGEYQDEERLWARGHTLDEVLARFQEVRGEQTSLLEQLSDDSLWREKRDTRVGSGYAALGRDQDLSAHRGAYP